MIRSKILWGCFAVVISFAFVGTGLSLRNSDSSNRDAQSIGKLHDETVSRQDFAMARYFELGMRHNVPDINEEQATELRKNVWRRIACLKAAQSMNLGATDSELRTAIQTEPTFFRDGVFDKNFYRAIVERSRGVQIKTFEDSVRQQITIHKLRQMLWLFAWTPHSETDQQLDDLTDTFTVEYITITTNNLDNPINLSQKDYQAFFDGNREMFRVPDKINVRYVSFPITNYTAGLSVEETDIQDYYESHTNDFTIATTSHSAVTTNDTTATTNNMMVLRDIKDVREEIENILKHRLAMFGARKAASKLEMAMARGRFAEALTMKQATDDQGLTICTSKFFSAQEPAPDLDVDESFTRAAFRLRPDTEHYFSSAIAGKENIYIIATETNTPSHIPDFTNIIKEVMPAAKEHAIRSALNEKTKLMHKAIAAALTSGQSFTNIVKKTGLEAQLPEPFSLYEVRTAGMYGSISNNLEQVQAFAPALAKLQTEELGEPIETENGSIIIHVIQRSASAPFLKDMLKPRLQESMDGYKASALFSDWQDYILKEGKLDDYVARRADAAKYDS